MRRDVILVCAGSLIIALAGAVVPPVVEAHGGGEGVIHACVKRAGGVRIVGANEPCGHWETALDWNIEGPPGPPGPSGSAGQFHAVTDFTASGVFTVPDGINRLLIEAWGGGGGGGGNEDNQISCANGGGGGGGGGYVQGVVEVTPGVTYDVTVGAAGAGGAAGLAGGDGGNTSFADGAVIFIEAEGGSGGQPGLESGFGAGGSGGAGNSNGGILISGTDGDVGGNIGVAGCGFTPGTGTGGLSVIGARLPSASAGGAGNPSEGGSGEAGGPGYLIIQW